MPGPGLRPARLFMLVPPKQGTLASEACWSVASTVKHNSA